MEPPRKRFRISSIIFKCQKYVKKGYMEMTKKIYLQTLKIVLGRSILHYFPGVSRGYKMGTFTSNGLNRRVENHIFLRKPYTSFP